MNSEVRWFHGSNGVERGPAGDSNGMIKWVKTKHVSMLWWSTLCMHILITSLFPWLPSHLENNHSLKLHYMVTQSYTMISTIFSRRLINGFHKLYKIIHLKYSLNFNLNHFTTFKHNVMIDYHVTSSQWFISWLCIRIIILYCWYLADIFCTGCMPSWNAYQFTQTILIYSL